MFTLPKAELGVGIAAAFHTDTSYRTMAECCRRCVTMGDPISRAPPTRRLGKPRPISRERGAWPWVDVFPQGHAAIRSQFVQLGAAARADAKISPAGKRRPIIRHRAEWSWVDVFPQRHAAIGPQFIQLGAERGAGALEPRRILENG